MRRFFSYLTTALVSSLVLISLSCQSTVKAKSEKANYRLEIAAAMMKGQNYPAALKELLVAAEEDPTHAGVQSALGTVYFVREKYELSEKHYLKALKLNPSFTQARNDLARSYIETGRYVRAEALLKEALEDLTYVNYHITYANYGILEFKKNNFTKAIEYLKKSLEKDRENCTTQVYLGRAFLEAADSEAALSQLERAISFCSQADSDLGHYYSAIALYRSKQPEKAQLRFEELVVLFPNGPNQEKAKKMIDIIKKSRQ